MLIILILIIPIIIVGTIFLYNYIRIKTAKVKVVLNKDLTLEVNTNRKVGEYITSINGKLLHNYTVTSHKLGLKKITIKYINDDGIKLNYTFNLKVIDKVPPLIWLGPNYSVKVGSKIDLPNKILCGDNYDSHPKCNIEGTYDLNTVGQYNLIYKASDSSGNETTKSFVLNVYKPKNDSSNQPLEYTDFNDVIHNYKTNSNQIGIDISKYQGSIDFAKLKQAGVEFVFINIGHNAYGKYNLDPNFISNITSANKYKIPVGIYFYSYTNSSKQAIQDAKWVLKNIKNYQVSLPIAFDWENWNTYNEYNLSFFGLTSMAEDFLDTVTKAGYKGMLYSSKNYLENIWLKTKYPIWLAQYNDNPTYTGKYKIWQMCDNGKVDGIMSYVDIDIMNK